EHASPGQGAVKTAPFLGNSIGGCQSHGLIPRSAPASSRAGGNGQEALVELAEGGIRIEIGKELGVEPLGQLLDGRELVGAGVELVPDGVDLAVRDRLG